MANCGSTILRSMLAMQDRSNRLDIARQHLRAELRADLTDPDEPGSRTQLDRWAELLDITERLENLMGVPHEE